MLSRRDVVGKLAAGTAVVLAAGTAVASVTRSRDEAPAGAGPQPGQPAAVDLDAAKQVSSPGQPVVDAEAPRTLSAPQPWELIAPLALGSTVAHGWKVAGLTGAVDGSCVLTLQNERGRSHRIHLCRNDGQPSGLVYTRQIDLLVMNGGEGDLPTDESLAQAVAEVAHVLAANESSRDATVTALLAHSERVRRFNGPEDRRLR